MQVDMGKFQDYIDADKLVTQSYRLPPAKAIEALRQALQREPEHPEANNNLAWLLVTGPKDLRNPQEALPLARKAVELSPNRYLFHNTLGVALYRSGNPAEAIPVLELSLKNQVEDAAAFDLFFLALCHHELGHIDQAKEYQERAVRWFKEHRSSLPKTYIEELTAFQAEAEEALKK
jgi:tetratricopeptide (TPR) repeat protein